MVTFIEVHLPLIDTAMRHKPDGLPQKFNWWFSIPVLDITTDKHDNFSTAIVRGRNHGFTIEWSSESIHVVRNWEARHRNKSLSDFRR